MIKIYISKKDVFSAKQILGKLTLLSPKENRLHFLNLLINFAEGNKELDQDSIDIIIKTDHVSDFVDALYEYCSETQDLQWCIDTLTPYTNKSVYNYLLQRRIALCHLELGRYKETIAYLEELISKDENIDVSDAYFIMAEAYLFIGKKDSLLKLSLAELIMYLLYILLYVSLHHSSIKIVKTNKLYYLLNNINLLYFL